MQMSIDPDKFTLDHSNHKILMSHIDIDIDKDGISALGNKAKKYRLSKTKEVRRITENSEVSYYIQMYIDTEYGLHSIYPQYKSQCTLKIPNAPPSKILERSCLLEMFDDSIYIFKIPSNYSNEVHSTIQMEIKNAKGKNALQNKNEEKNQSSDQLGGHNNNQCPKFMDDFLYLKIFVDLVRYNKSQQDPNSVPEFEKMINFHYNEIVYLIKKEKYKDAETWINSISAKVFDMPKTLRTKLNYSDKVKNSLYNFMKPIMMNKSLCIKKRASVSDNPHKLYSECIDFIQKTYFKYYSEKDNKYGKIKLRLAECYKEIKEFSKCKATLTEIIEQFKDPEIIKLANKMIIELDCQTQRVKNVKLNILKGLGKSQENNDENNFEWTECATYLDTSYNINGDLEFYLGKNH